MIRGLLQAGADYCLVRLFHMEVLGARLRQLASGPVPIPCPTRPSMAASSSPVYGRGGPSAWEVVGSLLSDLGIPTWVNGYRYLCRAIWLVVDDERLLTAVTQSIYPTIARGCESTPSRVERSIRHAIDTVWGRRDQDQLHRLFGCARPKPKPTNAEFIAVLADRLREPAGRLRAEGR
jgi:two-component system response regulator (stage 0 sporulation protein A)